MDKDFCFLNEVEKASDGSGASYVHISVSLSWNFIPKKEACSSRASPTLDPITRKEEQAFSRIKFHIYIYIFVLKFSAQREVLPFKK